MNKTSSKQPATCIAGEYTQDSWWMFTFAGGSLLRYSPLENIMNTAWRDLLGHIPSS